MKKLNLKLLVFLLFTMLVSSIFAQPNKLETAKRVEQTDKLVKPIEVYAKEIEGFVEKEGKPHMFFAEVSDRKSEKSFWIEYDSVESFEKAEVISYETAAVWKKDGKNVFVRAAYSSESGDWVEYYEQTYRADGTLAKLDRELRTFNGSVIANRMKIYDKDGKLLKESKSFRDLNTDKPLMESEANYMEVEAGTMYQKTSDLPFINARKNITVSRTSYEITDFIQKGWKLEYKAEGDLNGDSSPDLVLQLIQEETEDSKEIQRMLIILIRHFDNKYTKFAEAKKLLMCKGCGGMLGNISEIVIEKGVLQIEQMSGSRSGTNISWFFGYEPTTKRFRLIGENVNNFDRLELTSEETTTNYETGKQMITKSKGGENDVTETVTRKSVPKSKIYFEDVNYENY